jgi:hypothetical protein
VTSKVIAVVLLSASASCFAAHPHDQSKVKIQAAQATLTAGLKDPESVEYKNLRYVTTKDVVCGQYNAKNSFGAYVGFHYFAVDADGAHVMRFPEELPRMHNRAQQLAILNAGQAEAHRVGELCLDSESRSPHTAGTH